MALALALAMALAMAMALAGIEMTKEQMLEIIKLLSALESWSFSAGHRMPDYLFEKIDKAMDELTQEVLK